MSADTGWHRFTLHVDFMATNEHDARVQAEAYAMGLRRPLRPG